MKKGISLLLIMLAWVFLGGGIAFPQEQLWNELNSKIHLLQKEKKYDEAIKTSTQALEVAEKTFGRDHPNTVKSMNNLARLFEIQGQYDEAEPLYARALAISKKALGSKHPDTATCMTNLAGLYKLQARYSDAEPLYKKALSIREKALGPQHPDTAASLHDLASFYKLQGRYSHAEQLYKKALAIREKALGLQHPDTAASLNDLALIYEKEGRYDDAEPLLKRALAIDEKTLGPEHPDTAVKMNNLADLYIHRGRYTLAEQLSAKALAIREKALGPDSPHIAYFISSLATIYRLQRRFSEAEPLLKRALAIREKASGPDGPGVAAGLIDLGVLYKVQGRYADAEPLYKRALAIREKTLGPESPGTATVLSNLANLLVATGRPADALPLMQRTFSIDDHTIEDVFTHATEKQKFAFLATVQGNYVTFMNLVAQKLKDKPEALTAGLDAVLRRKGIVLDTLSRERDSLMESENPKVQALYQKLQDQTTLISALTLTGPGETSMQKYRAKLKGLQAKREILEKDLTASSRAYAKKKHSPAPDCRAVAGKLPPGSALVEYLCIRMRDFNATGDKKTWGESRYFAYVLTSSQGAGPSQGGSPAPKLVDLGEASAIDSAVKEFRAEIDRTRTLWESGVLDEAATEKSLAEKGRHLYELTLAPLKKSLGERTTLFLAPDAYLNLIPFGALKDEKGNYMVENYRLYYLSCGRDLMHFDDKAENDGETVIVANPDFDMSASQRLALLKGAPVEGHPADPQPADEQAAEDVPVAAPGTTRSADLAFSAWNPLPGTLKEAGVIKKVLEGEKIREYQGQSALEEAVKNLHSPRRLHIATHGFFLEDQDRSLLLMEGTQESSSDEPAHAKTPALKIENPLLRSGVVFAGANKLGKEQLPRGCGDGVLTALEISGIPLRGTDLVVLSACETGLGKVNRGEGVFGLGRAFHLAGARTVVMSLWSVPDQETQELMSGFYQRLKKGEGKAASLRGSSLAIIKERREKYKAAHPFFWASFVSVGEP